MINGFQSHVDGAILVISKRLMAPCLTWPRRLFKYINIQLPTVTSDSAYAEKCQSWNCSCKCLFWSCCFYAPEGAEPRRCCRGCFYRAVMNGDAGQASRCLTCSAWKPKHKRAYWRGWKNNLCGLLARPGRATTYELKGTVQGEKKCLPAYRD